jgi:ketosteroid isomerase-like protein
LKARSAEGVICAAQEGILRRNGNLRRTPNGKSLQPAPMKALRLLATTLTLASIGPATAADPSPSTRRLADEVIDVEKEFAAAFVVKQWPAFLDFVSDDAEIYAGGKFVSAREAYTDLASRTAGQPPITLDWRPSRVEVACSGDLAWSTGPVRRVDVKGEHASHYVTVWVRGSGGRWVWIYDRGSPQQDPAEKVVKAEGRMSLPDCRGPLRSSGGGAASVAEAERRLFEALRTGAAPARWLAPDVRLHRYGRPPIIGSKPALQLIRAEPRILSYIRRAGRVSADGTLAYNYGTVQWVEGERGHQAGAYLQIWRRTMGGWRLVLDQITPETPPERLAPA